MKSSRTVKKVLASALAIVLAVGTVIGGAYKKNSVQADESAVKNGFLFTATNGENNNFTGAVVQGFFENQRMHFAWGIDVDAATVAATVNDVEMTRDTQLGGIHAKGCFIYLDAVLAAVGNQTGAYVVKITATTAETADPASTEVSFTANLNIATAEETTTAEPATPDADGWTPCTLNTVDNSTNEYGWPNAGDWPYYASRDASYKIDGDQIGIRVDSAAGDDYYSIQVRSKNYTLQPGSKYNVTFVVNTTQVFNLETKVEPEDQSAPKHTELVVGDNTITETLTASEATAHAFFGLGKVNEGTIFTVKSISFELASEEETTDPNAPDPDNPSLLGFQMNCTDTSIIQQGPALRVIASFKKTDFEAAEEFGMIIVKDNLPHYQDDANLENAKNPEFTAITKVVGDKEQGAVTVPGGDENLQYYALTLTNNGYNKASLEQIYHFRPYITVNGKTSYGISTEASIKEVAEKLYNPGNLMPSPEGQHYLYLNVITICSIDDNIRNALQALKNDIGDKLFNTVGETIFKTLQTYVTTYNAGRGEVPQFTELNSLVTGQLGSDATTLYEFMKAHSVYLNEVQWTGTGLGG